MKYAIVKDEVKTKLIATIYKYESNDEVYGDIDVVTTRETRVFIDSINDTLTLKEINSKSVWILSENWKEEIEKAIEKTRKKVLTDFSDLEVLKRLKELEEEYQVDVEFKIKEDC